jgi:hypothetical protein
MKKEAMSFTKDDISTLKTLRSQTEEKGLEVFTFKGAELRTDYAKYLIEHLENHFGVKPNK